MNARLRVIAPLLSALVPLFLIAGCSKKESDPQVEPPAPAASASASGSAAASTPSAPAPAPSASSPSAASASASASGAPSGSTPSAPAPKAGATSIAAAASAKPGASAVASAAADPKSCGKKPLPDCPLQGWMKHNTAAAMAAEDMPALAAAFDKIVTFAPAGYTNWASISRDGAAAARAGHLDAVKAACRGCHDQYRTKYRTDIRANPIP